MISESNKIDFERLDAETNAVERHIVSTLPAIP